MVLKIGITIALKIKSSCNACSWGLTWLVFYFHCRFLSILWLLQLLILMVASLNFLLLSDAVYKCWYTRNSIEKLGLKFILHVVVHGRWSRVSTFDASIGCHDRAFQTRCNIITGWYSFTLVMHIWYSFIGQRLLFLSQLPCMRTIWHCLYYPMIMVIILCGIFCD